MLKYIISNYGSGIAIGIVGNKQEAEQLGVLGENLYGLNHSEEYFDYFIYAPNFKKFRELLIMKEYYNQWDNHWDLVNHYKIQEGEEKSLTIKPSVLKFTKQAILSVNKIISNNVSMENFMQNISNRNQTYSLGNVYAEKPED